MVQSTATSGDIKLNDVMLAMDIADTLRHKKLLVERVLNEDTQRQKLIDRIRSIYESQGIDVSDAVIEEAVKAIRDKRFSYNPPPDGLATRFWKLYVRRGQWGKKVAAGFAAILAAFGIHYGVVTVPQTAELKHQITTLNDGIKEAGQDIDLLSDRLVRVNQSYATLHREFPVTLQKTAEDIRKDIATDLQKTGQLLKTAREFSLQPDLKPGNFVERKKPATVQLEQQQTVLSKVENRLDRAEELIQLLQELDQVPQELKRLNQVIVDVAQEPAGKLQADALLKTGFTALRSRDGEKIHQSLVSMQELLALLEREYSLRIVARPGERSGVWRRPDTNSLAKNYYLIVEAISADGEILAIPVTSEETGELVDTKTWGVRVSATDYNRIGADKQDNGIIEQNIVAVKKRGFLKPDYRINTTGGTITKW
ncbi:MAG: DUF6384 family protein [Gammaproteobacteria bacterium]